MQGAMHCKLQLEILLKALLETILFDTILVGIADLLLLVVYAYGYTMMID